MESDGFAKCCFLFFCGVEHFADALWSAHFGLDETGDDLQLLDVEVAASAPG